jgi:hypothetical protein
VLKEKALSALPASVTGKTKRAGKKGKASKKTVKNVKTEEAQSGVLRLKGQKAKYQISDITGRLAERGNVTLSVGWNVQPWVGALLWAPATGAWPRTGGSIVSSEAFDFPALKGKKAEGQAQESASV